MSVGADKCTPHSLPIAEPSRASNLFDRKTTLLNHEARRLQAKILDGLGRGYTGFGMKDSTELTWAETGGAGKLFDSQRFSQISPRKIERVLDAIRFRA